MEEFKKISNDYEIEQFHNIKDQVNIYFSKISSRNNKYYNIDSITTKEIINSQDVFLGFYLWDKMVWIVSYRVKDQNTLYLSRFYIWYIYQNQWYGKRMMHHFIKNAQSWWYKYILLETIHKNRLAKAFYSKIWFKKLSNRKINKLPFYHLYKKIVRKTIMYYIFI